MASQVIRPIFNESLQFYEMDEMRVVVGFKRNEAWLTYAINRKTKRVVDFEVGRRTKRNISKVSNSVLKLWPKMVFTDGLPTYKVIIPKSCHNTTKRNTMIIERNNLTLRTNLKRLARKTICFSKTFEMLEATLKFYFWGDHLFG